MSRPDFILPADAAGEFYTSERCHITELFNDSSSPDASLARARVEPGVTTQLHALAGTREIYIVEAGNGLVEVDGRSAAVGPGDRVDIPAGAPQRITNTGETDLVFLCLCTPRFVPEAYQSLEAD
jgi:mannose-6-phosphate isomerase-like protein (cupin superfamily)